MGRVKHASTNRLTASVWSVWRSIVRVNVVIDLLAPPRQWPNLGDGHRVEARIVVFSADDVLQVPLSALFRLWDAWGVFTVAKGRASQRLIQGGPRGEHAVVVEEGGAAGEWVIVYPPDAVQDSVRVKVRVAQP